MQCMRCNAELPPGALFCPACGKKQGTVERKPLKRANGSGTVYKLKGRLKRPWVAARKKVIVGYYSTKTEALAALEETKSQVMEHYKDTVADVRERWKSAHYPGLTDNGRKGYEVVWHRVGPIIGSKYIRDVRMSDWQQIVDEAKKEDGCPLSASGKSKIKQFAAQICRQAMKDDIIHKNYGELIEVEPEKKKPVKTWSNEDEEKLWALCDDTAKITLMLIYSGLRIGELFGMLTADVNTEKRYATGGEKTDTGRNRIIPIHTKTVSLWEEFAERGGEYLISDKNGRKLNPDTWRAKRYYPMLEELGISRKTPHTTRKTAATRAYAAGARTEDLTAVLGHADFDVTADYYIDFKLENLAEAIEKI